MSEQIVLPALGESVTEGTVTRWLKQVGDHVEVDEPLLEVSTDKVDTEVPSPISGTLQQILVQEDETVEVGAVLAVVGDGAAAEAPAQTEAAPAQSQPESAPEEAPAPAETEAAAAPAKTEAAAAPAAGASATGEQIVLPALGESVTEGTVTRWLKQVGDHVDEDEPLLEVSTDKVDTEVPSPISGTLQQILVQEDETVEVGAVLAVVGDGAAPAAEPAAAEAAQAPEEAPAPEAAPAPQPEPATPSAAPQPKSEPAATTEPEPASPAPAAEQSSAERRSGQVAALSGHAYVTPIVRKLASRLGIDLDQVTGTGVGGRIRKEDVLNAQAAQATQPSPGSTAAASSAPEPKRGYELPKPSDLRGQRVPLSRLRQVLARNLVHSMQTAAQLTSVVEVDLTAVASFRQQHKAEFQQKTGQKLSYLPFFAYAVAQALPAHPAVNASIDGDEVVYHDRENIAFAVDTEKGLYAPVVHEAGKQSLADLAKSIAEVAERSRVGSLKPDDVVGGTFTITNTGSRGSLLDTPIFSLPQSAILGTGAVTKQPRVLTVDGQDVIAIRSVAYLSLSYDHRIIDGADAARFLGEVKAIVEQADFSSALGI
ncbi:2-oxoglutarate dehydrogenase, E2 component, dihydrolipoamide succinyltransferase [Pseudoclavibacter sp. CFCC 13611]|uniref:2-oxoglutarate dehydrogenase, E2 component, dihydrolipoamide succinyltransferase n=1 Tax=Pseudoclavibacter sp. CFCC 13611 TaxID=2615178 RepID=UPI0013012009|nr:2-oxoglutarate dehydrogenase, E2 component, dihydrolipoamide succinyltransferase [Pseudoclavibacter sp. CFCC 13611]KAB1663551.1 2-oxoglutarate dehydrogenase, E2 component, dihydrolipoamide succinyltransferase [Pseudoclavibacter sp. CFCC 13611]